MFGSFFSLRIRSSAGQLLYRRLWKGAFVDDKRGFSCGEKGALGWCEGTDLSNMLEYTNRGLKFGT